MEPNTKKSTSQHERLYWFKSKYDECIGNTLSLDEIIEDYCKEKENLKFQLSKRDVRPLVRSILGEVTSFELKRDGKRTLTFLNIGKRKALTESNSQKWKEMQTGAIYNGWLLREMFENPPMLSFSKLAGVTVDGNELVLQLSIDPLTLEFDVRSSYGTLQKGKDFVSAASGNLMFLLGYLSKCNACVGVEETSQIMNVVRNGEDPLCRVLDINGKQHFISKKCQLLVVDGKCNECTYLKKRLVNRKQEINVKFTKHSLMGTKELEQKVTILQREKQNAKNRAAQWKTKFEKESFEMVDEDNKDLATILKGIDDDSIPDDMRLLLQQQRMALRSTKNGYRWHPKIIRLCMDIYTTSAKAFDTMKQHLILPSKRLIRYYKNAVPCSSGWNDEVMAWCQREADNLKMEGKDFWGGLVFDEMTIQEDLEFVKVGGKKRLVGAVDLGKGYEDARILTGGTNEPELASKVMQFALVSDNGFRFNLAHFPVKNMPAQTLLEKFWEGIDYCERIGFKIYWLVCDGRGPNRSFLQMLFPYGTDPEEHGFVAANLHTGEKIAIMSDSKHCFKKIRNHLVKSTVHEKSTRKLTVNNTLIVFEFWKKAFKWDQECHSFPLHENLTEAHFELDARSRMRNYLAEDVLDKKMLYLMQEYQKHLKDTGKVAEADAIKESIKFLEYTSQLIDLFSRKDQLVSCEDTRLLKAKMFLQYLRNWKSETEDPKEFFSDKLWFDLRSMVMGLCKAVEIKTNKFPGVGIKPVIINQDVIENTFCQVRASNGQNNHPKYQAYCSTITSVNIGQSVLSKKSNTNGNKDALPKSGLPKQHPFSKKSKLNCNVKVPLSSQNRV